MASYLDTFTRVAGPLAGSTSSDGLFTWTVPDGVDPGTNGVAIAFSGVFTGLASADCATDAIFVEVDFTFVSGTPALWLDLASNGVYPGSGSHGYEFAMFGGNAFIFAIANGAFTQLATVAHTVANGTYRAERNGSALALYRNGGLILSATNNSEPTGAGNRRAGAGGDGTGTVGGEVYTEFRYGDLAAGAAPFTGRTDANPARARADVRGSVDGSDFGLLKDSQFAGPGQFASYDWPNPRGPRRSVDLLTGTSNDLTSRLPPPAVAAPFSVSDWPNPRGRSAPRVGFEAWYAIDDSAPFSQDDWPNPTRARTRAQDWTSGLNVALFVPPGVPFAQTAWPNPVRAVARVQDWTAGLTVANLPQGAPFAQDDWPNPLRLIVRRQDWAQGLNLPVFVPPGAPFSQDDWPNPVLAIRSREVRGFVRASAFQMLRDAMPFAGLAPVVPRGAQFPVDLRGSTQHALTTVPTPPAVAFRPTWAVNSNRTVGF